MYIMTPTHKMLPMYISTLNYIKNGVWILGSVTIETFIYHFTFLLQYPLISAHGIHRQMSPVSSLRNVDKLLDSNHLLVLNIICLLTEAVFPYIFIIRCI